LLAHKLLLLVAPGNVVNADIVSSGAMNTTMPMLFMTTKREVFIIFFVPPSRRIGVDSERCEANQCFLRQLQCS